MPNCHKVMGHSRHAELIIGLKMYNKKCHCETVIMTHERSAAFA